MSRQSNLSNEKIVNEEPNSVLDTDPLAFTLRLSETPARRPSDEICATSHPLKWNPLPPNDVDRIVQHVRDKEGTKESVFP